MSSLKATLPLAICLLTCLISMIAAKPSPRYFLIETKGKNNDYQADYANFYWEGSSRYRKNRDTGSDKNYRLQKPNGIDYKDYRKEPGLPHGLAIMGLWEKLQYEDNN